MSEKINNVESASQQLPEFSPSFVKWLIVLTVGTLLLIFIQNPSGNPNESDNYQAKYLLSPWIIAGGYTIASAIQEFSTGEGFQEVTRTTQITTLLGILIAFVVAPTLFLVGWRRFYEQQTAGKKPWSLLYKPMGILIIIGGAITVWVALSSLPVAFMQYDVFQSMRASQNVNDNKDALYSEVTSITRAGQVYHTVPKSLGGGEGSYVGFSLPDTMIFPHGTIQISHASPDSLCVEGISNAIAGAVVFSTLDSAGVNRVNFTGF